MGKVYTRFQTKTAQKPYPLGRHIPVWLIEGSTPGIRHKSSFGSFHNFHSVSGLLFPQQKPVSFPFIYLFSDPKGSCCFFHFEITGLDFTTTAQNNPESKKLREKSFGAPFWANKAHTAGSWPCSTSPPWTCYFTARAEAWWSSISGLLLLVATLPAPFSLQKTLLHCLSIFS